MSNNIERSFSVKNRNFHPEETPPQSSGKVKVTRHFTNQVYQTQNSEQKPTKDVEKVNELIKLSEQIKKELLKVKFCILCKRKFQSMKYLIEHEENSEVHKKIKQ
ncbi:unnamed protein product [Paramecium sonneborni]|uniref:Uncharacterized protein n=1 Tax=Paramecium sonneborni TaxID=65129 RepID=A0A8S1RJ77_9CILI|nr:unnamed protein product [Paramecium sonneborni]